jgi:thioredoxin 1
MGGKGMTALTDANFETEVLRNDTPVVVDFTATWCGPCKQLVPVLEKAAEEYEGRVKFGKVDVDANRQTAMTYMVRSIPTLLIFKGGAVVQQSVGLINAKKLKDMLENVL